MAPDHETQAAEELSREAERLLAEYFRIRREYNALDRENPTHADRRTALKDRYHELDRKYTQLVKTQDQLVEEDQGPPRSRADVLWNGATQTPARVNEPMESPPPDAPWIELTTPVEGAAADQLFEEALRQVGQNAPDEFADAPQPGKAVEDDTAADGAVPTPYPDADFDGQDEHPVKAHGNGGASTRPAPAPFAVDALRELTEHLRSGDLEELAAPKPGAREAAETGRADSASEPFIELDPAPLKPIVPRPSRERRAAKSAPKDAGAKAIACPSCGERLLAGTQACRYCGARLIAAETAEGVADPVLPHLQLQLAEPKQKPHFGAKAVIALGWLMVWSAAAWLVALNTNFRIEEIHAWLNSYGMAMLRKDESGGILGVAVVLLGGTLVGAGIFATRFVRVVVSMHELARNGRVDSIEKLIMEGAELDQRDERGCTPLHFAIVAKQREVVAVLAGNGADVNSHNNRGDTPLHMAAANRDHALVQYLLKKGADAEAVNDGGSTLLHVAAQVGDVGLLKLFLEKGLAIDQPTNVGFTPLHFAAQSGHEDAIEFLVDNGADPNAASDHGTTPIFPATRNGHLPSVRLLVDAGADYNARRGHDFESPLGLARAHKRREILDYLESIGAED